MLFNKVYLLSQKMLQNGAHMPGSETKELCVTYGISESKELCTVHWLSGPRDMCNAYLIPEATGTATFIIQVKGSLKNVIPKETTDSVTTKLPQDKTERKDSPWQQCFGLVLAPRSRSNVQSISNAQKCSGFRDK